MLADSESEKTKWVVALNELHRILKKNKLPDRSPQSFRIKRRCPLQIYSSIHRSSIFKTVRHRKVRKNYFLTCELFKGPKEKLKISDIVSYRKIGQSS
jgi:hypothetical protein